MKFTQFIKMALNMTVQYNNNYVKENGIDIGEEDVCIEYTIDNREVFVCVLCVEKTPVQKYVVSYDKKTKKIESYLARNIDNFVQDKKEGRGK